MNIVSSTPKALIIDSSERAALHTKSMLESLDIDVHTTCDAHDSLALIKKHEYFVVLLETDMPKLDGFSLSEQIQEHYKTPTPIIFFSDAEESEAKIDKAYEAGGVDYFVKPIRSKELNNKVSLYKKISKQQNNLKYIADSLRYANERNQKILNSAGAGVIYFDMQGSIDYINPMAEKLLGIFDSDQLAKKLHFQDVLVIEESENRSINAMWADLPLHNICAKGEPYETEVHEFKAADGSTFPVEIKASPVVEGTSITGIVVLFQDITFKKTLENQLLELSQFDEATALPNRIKFYSVVDQALAKIRPQALDDDYKAILLAEINPRVDAKNLLSPQMKDQFLKIVAERLVTQVSADIVARLGSNKFAIFLNHLDKKEDAARVAQSILDVMHEQITLDSGEVALQTFIGVALHERNQTTDKLISAAEFAVNNAIESNESCYKFSEIDVYFNAVEYLSLEKDLKFALEKEELQLLYQPKVRVDDNKIVGMEALIQWVQKSRGDIAPNIFIPVAEDSGLINPIGNWVLHEACYQIKSWNEDNNLNLPLSVSLNIAAAQIYKSDFDLTIRAALEQTGLSPDQLEIEISEGVINKNIGDCIDVMRRIRDLGVKISVDDFGTGYCSIRYLQALPIDRIKIDLSLINSIGKNENNDALIKMIIEMSHRLGLHVVAEGVETAKQLAFLKAAECDTYQGYYYSKPLSLTQTNKLLQ